MRNETLISGRILFVGAHCDDIEIGCGGTAAKYSEKGKQIAFAIATPEDNGTKENLARSSIFSEYDIKVLSAIIDQWRGRSSFVS